MILKKRNSGSVNLITTNLIIFHDCLIFLSTLRFPPKIGDIRFITVAEEKTVPEKKANHQ